MLLHRDLDDALGLSEMAAGPIADTRTGRNGRHRLAGLLRQTVFPRLAGYEDVNDADRLARDPVVHQLVGCGAPKKGAAPAGRRTGWFVITPASTTGRRAGRSRAEWSQRSSSIRASCFPRIGFIVTNRRLPNERVLAFYNDRGTAGQHIKEGK